MEVQNTNCALLQYKCASSLRLSCFLLYIDYIVYSDPFPHHWNGAEQGFWNKHSYWNVESHVSPNFSINNLCRVIINSIPTESVIICSTRIFFLSFENSSGTIVWPILLIWFVQWSNHSPRVLNSIFLHNPNVHMVHKKIHIPPITIRIYHVGFICAKGAF